MRKDVKMYLVIIGMICLLTGCFDKIEVEDRAFVVTLGLDQEEDLLEVTYSTPDLSAVTGQESSPDGKIVKSIKGKGILDTEEKFIEKSGLALSLGHVKMILLGKGFMESEDSVKKAMDYFSRDSDIAMSTLVVGTDDMAKTISNKSPKAMALTGEYITQLIDRATERARVPYHLNLGELIIHLENYEGLEVIPMVNIEEDDIVLDGLNIMNHYKSQLRLDYEDAKTYHWLIGKGKMMIVDFEYKDQNLNYIITEIQRIVKVTEEEDNLTIELIIETEGDINTYLIDEKEEELSEDAIQEIEKAINQSMEKKTAEVLNTIQNAVGRDVFFISEDLRIYNQALWMKIEENYDNYFNSANIKITVKNKIRRIGKAL